VTIQPFPRDCEDVDNNHWFVRDAVVDIPKYAALPPGMSIMSERVDKMD
jgi:hypothetical protein